MRRAATRWLILLTAAAVLLGIASGISRLNPDTAAASTITQIAINGAKAGPAFQGVGAISGGGGNSRLLIDYPEPERGQILDYLFKPDYGAALQLLKLEIGGDANTSDGAEPSIEHTEGRIDCASGYEWWLAGQAKARNARIKLYGLQWAAPGWVGRDGTLWTAADVRYVIDWLNCAESRGLTIDYVGGWNERHYNASWYEELRSALNAHGYRNVKIVAADQAISSGDGEWSVATALASEPAFDAAVSVIGAHDSCGYPTTAYTCTSSAAARGLRKPLWESEIGAMDANTGAAAMARSINNSYIQAGVTGLLEWPLLDSIAPGLRYENRGLVTADEPWSGQYTVDRMTWAIAQTTQFVAPGWRHVGGASKRIGNSGSCDTYQAPNHSAWTLVAQNTGAHRGQAVLAQTIRVRVTGGLRASTIRVWATNLQSSHPSQWFARWNDIHPADGVFTYTIPAGYVVTFTTTSGQAKVGRGSPAPAAMPLPYTAKPDASNEPWGLSPQDGAFEYAPCLGGAHGDCIEQMAPRTPVWWSKSVHQVRFPYAIVGSSNWKNYTVSSAVLFSGAGEAAGVIGRFSSQAASSDKERFDGYELTLTARGAWRLLRNTSSSGPATLRSGDIAGIGTSRWHTLSLRLQDDTIAASVDGRTVATAADSSFSSGIAGIESNWTPVQFNNVAVR